MECIYLIYKATSPSGKIYIGKTSKTLEKRIADHCYEAKKNRYNIAFHNALRKHNAASFTWEILACTKDPNHINELEILMIKQYDATNHDIGYNRSHGGDGVNPTQEIRDKISLSTTLANKKKYEDPVYKRLQQDHMAKMRSNSAIQTRRIAALKSTRSSVESRQKSSVDSTNRYADVNNRNTMAIACGAKGAFTVHKDGAYIGEFVSAKYCAIQLFNKVSAAKYIGYCLKNIQPHYKNYTFQYITKA